MFSKKFWLDAGESFAVAAAAVVVVDVEALIAAGSWEQAAVVGLALGRAAVIAGVKVIAPRFLALRDREAAE